MAAVPTPSLVPSPVGQWPADVLEFAAQHQVAAYLDPLLEATQRLFPSARRIRVEVESDPELHNVSWLLFRIAVLHTDVPDVVQAYRSLDTELFRICPAPLVHNFVLRLQREDESITPAGPA